MLPIRAFLSEYAIAKHGESSGSSQPSTKVWWMHQLLNQCNANAYSFIHTFEMSGKNGFKIRRLNCAIRFRSKEFLFKGVSCLSEMEEEELHEAGFSISAEDLFQAVHTLRPLIPQSWSRKTAMFAANYIVCLGNVSGMLEMQQLLCLPEVVCVATDTEWMPQL
jgi:hypothetical protein